MRRRSPSATRERQRTQPGTQITVDYDAVPVGGKDTTDAMLIFKLEYAI